MSQTKFDCCVQSMMQEVAVKVLDLIRNPPEDYPYPSLKAQLLRMFALNNYACAEAIANLPLMGDMQPSALMSRMLGLLPDGHKPCFFLRAAFLKHLPADVRAHLVHDRTSDPLTLILRADKIFQSHVSSASAMNHVSSALVLGDEYFIHAVCSQASSHPPHYSTPGPSSRCALPLPQPLIAPTHPLCWYNRSLAEKAHKYRAPCSWLGN